MKYRAFALSFTLGIVGACTDADDQDTPLSPDSGALSILKFEPTGTTATRPIEIWFSKAVVPETSIRQPLRGPAPLLISPSVPGEYEWRGVDHLAFIPSEPFRQSTRYTVSVKSDAFGERLGGDLDYRFNTELFSLRSVEPFYESAGSVRVNLVFTHPVRASDAAVAVRFETANGDAIGARIQTNGSGEAMAFALDPIPVDKLSDPILVHVEGGLAAVGGGASIGKKIVRQLRVETAREELKIHNIYAEEDGGQFTLRIRFSADVAVAAAKSAISVRPNVDFEVVDGYWGVGLRGPFQPSTSYEVRLNQGLVATNGSALAQDMVRRVAVPDFDPSVNFESAGTYLMKAGRQALSVKTINVQKLEVRVDKVPENNLAHVVPRIRARSVSCSDGGCYDADDEWYDDENTDYYYGSDLGSLGTSLFSGAVDVAHERNKPVVTTVPFTDIDADDRRGVYRVRITDSERGWIYAEKWMLATDLGLTVKVGRREARAQVISLVTSRPVGGVKVQFVSRTNEVIGRAWTGADGSAILTLDNARAGEPLSLVTAEKGDDFSYLALSGTAIPTADFDVGGDGDTTAPYEAYVYPDRGIYRPGDRAHLVVLVRDRSLQTPGAFPFSVEIRNPKWRVFRTMRGNTSDDGAVAYTIDIPQDALTGNYTVRVLSAADGAALGRRTIKVEEFMPDRIKVDVKARQAVGEIGDSVPFDIESLYLFGPPGAGLQVDSRCRFSEIAIVATKYRAFPIATDAEGEERAPLNSIVELGPDTLDESGKAVATCSLDPSHKPQRPVRATLLATVSERGGRAVTGSGSVVLHGQEHYVGVRRNSSERYAKSKEDAGLEVLVVDRKGAVVPGVQVNATIWSVEYKSILKMVNGRYRYVSERVPKKIGDATAKSGARPVNLSFEPPRHGSYRIDVETIAGAKSSVSFWVTGSGYGAWEMSNPDQVSLTLDKASYAVGDTATMMVRAPFSGRLYVTVERDTVLYAETIELTGNTGSVTIPVSQTMIPNAYVTAQLIRARSSVEKAAPMRAFGVVPLSVQSDKHRLGVKVIAPDDIRPNTTLDVKLKIDAARGPAHVTVAAVDEGILRITGHTSPDPLGFFSRKRRLGIRTHDLFDLLLPEVDGRATAIVRKSGGDGANKKHLTPMSVKRVKPVALWSGLLETSADGWARAKLEVPQFNGTLRLMVVAFQGDRFGAASQQVKVRDPIVLTPTLPRFVGPLDKFFVPVEVFNGTGQASDIRVTISADGKLKGVGNATQSIRLANGAQGKLTFVLQADEVAGKAKVVISAEGIGAKTQSETELAIRAPSTVVTEGESFLVSAAEPAKYTVPAGFLPGTVQTRITVGPTPAAKFGASMQYLLQYPHGCVEQTTSRAFPLLYLADLAKASASDLIDGDSGVDDYVNGGIGRLLSMQTSGGAMAYWPGGERGYAWATVYAIHFLVEAKKAGYEVDDASLKRGLDHLAAIAREASLPVYHNVRPSRRAQAYALYVLAVGGRPLLSELHHLASRVDKEKVVDPEARALVDGALLIAGDTTRTKMFIDKQLPLAAAGSQSGFWSRTRADALMLSVLADVYPRHKSVPVLMKRLTDATKIGRWGNTQENAFALMALGKIGGKLEAGGEYWGTVHVGSTEEKKFNSKRPTTVTHDGDDWVKRPIEIMITGRGTAFAGIEVQGIKAGIGPAKQAGLTVKRAYLDSHGAAIDTASIRQGDMIYTKITVAAEGGARVENIAIVDLLPAGLEIENPRLKGDAIAEWMKDRSVPEYMDIRDDRLILFSSLTTAEPQSFYYAARAVTEGDFVLPHVHVEAMYDPTVHAFSGGGKLSVRARQ